MDNLIDPNLANSFKNKSPERKAILLTDYMVKNGITYYDESVTQLEHALQAGNLARNAGADAFLTSAALLHDIGHFLLDEHDFQQFFLEEDLNHEVVGANYLSYSNNLIVVRNVLASARNAVVGDQSTAGTAIAVNNATDYDAKTFTYA